MRLGRRLLAPALATLGLAGSLGLATGSAAHADTTTPLPSLKGFQQMAVDSADGYPSTLAVQSGKLWVGYASPATSSDGIGDVDLTTGMCDTVATGLIGLPDLAADPSRGHDQQRLVRAWEGIPRARSVVWGVARTTPTRSTRPPHELAWTPEPLAQIVRVLSCSVYFDESARHYDRNL